MKVERALEHWRREGLLDEAKARELEVSLDALAEERSQRGIWIFATLGAVLVGVGLLLFVGSNWDRMGPALRGVVLLGFYGAVVAAAWEAGRRGYERLGEALWLLATLAFGADVFFLGQIFNFTLTFWQGPLVWLLGVLAMGFARRRAFYGHLAVPLLLLFLGWLGGGAGWFMDDQLEFLVSDRGLRPLLPLVGLGLVSLGILLERFPPSSFATRACRAWGLLLAAAMLVSATVADGAVSEIFDTAWTSKQISIAVVAGLLVVATLAFGGLRSTAGRAVLAGAGVLAFAPVISPGGHSFVGAMAHESGVLFAVFVLAVFALGLATIWAGLQVSSRALVNAGMASLTVLILIQYFSWTFELLASSLAFIFGGLLVLALAFFMERARRRLLARMETP